LRANNAIPFSKISADQDRLRDQYIRHFRQLTAQAFGERSAAGCRTALGNACAHRVQRVLPGAPFQRTSFNIAWKSRLIDFGAATRAKANIAMNITKMNKTVAEPMVANDNLTAHKAHGVRHKREQHAMWLWSGLIVLIMLGCIGAIVLWSRG
jgi:hypothetical protein